ncbi:MAG: hypothetical protein SWO11_16440 [Thermodesulfobacteriota bacterium]|nr:hypothetical protein [Thermodesulfobacteriota bacterium]
MRNSKIVDNLQEATLKDIDRIVGLPPSDRSRLREFILSIAEGQLNFAASPSTRYIR